MTSGNGISIIGTALKSSVEECFIFFYTSIKVVMQVLNIKEEGL